MEPASPAADFKVRDAESYRAHVESFDRFSRVLTLPFAARLWALGRGSGAGRVLDVGTGTGIVALEVGRTSAPGVRCVGVDLSAPMLERARANAAARGLSERVSFEEMDAEALRFAEGEFDAALSLFALLHLPHPERALAELFRVLSPGGVLAVAVGAAPELGSRDGLVELPRALGRRVAARLGLRAVAPGFLDALVAKHVPARAGPEESQLAREGHRRGALLPGLVQEAGFREVAAEWMGSVARFDSPAEFFEIQRTFSSFARKRLEGATAGELAAVRAAFDARCAAVQARGGALVYPLGAFFVVAKKPGAR